MRSEWPGWNALELRLARWGHLDRSDSSNGNTKMGRVVGRKEGENEHLFGFFAGLNRSSIESAEETLGRKIPDHLHTFYSATNGAHIFNISIGGIVQEVRRETELDAAQPISLRYGNVVERPQGLHSDDFVFGSMTGYNVVGKLVTDAGGEVRLVHPQVGSDVAKSWTTFEGFLFEEMDRISAFYDCDGQYSGSWNDYLHPSAAHWDSTP